MHRNISVVCLNVTCNSDRHKIPQNHLNHYSYSFICSVAEYCIMQALPDTAVSLIKVLYFNFVSNQMCGKTAQTANNVQLSLDSSATQTNVYCMWPATFVSHTNQSFAEGAGIKSKRRGGFPHSLVQRKDRLFKQRLRFPTKLLVYNLVT